MPAVFCSCKHDNFGLYNIFFMRYGYLIFYNEKYDSSDTAEPLVKQAPLISFSWFADIRIKNPVFFMNIGFFNMAAFASRQAHTLIIPFYSCRLASSCIYKYSLYFQSNYCT